MAEAVRSVTSPVGEMVLHADGVIVHTLASGALVDTESASAVLELTRDLAAGAQVAVVVDLRAIAFADRDARDQFARDPAGGVEVATALVVGPRVAGFLARQFVESAQPDRPTQVFEDISGAREWAVAQLRAATEG